MILEFMSINPHENFSLRIKKNLLESAHTTNMPCKSQKVINFM